MILRRWWRLGVVIVLIATLVIISVSVGVPGVSRLRADLDQFGAWAGVVFAGLYVLVSLAPLPASVFALAAGALFGLAEGLVAVLAGATVGALIAFYLARALGREFVVRVSGASVERFDDRFAARGPWGMLVVRLIPVLPFAAVNYAGGLTAIRTRDYLLGTVLGILPSCAAYVAIGAYGSEPGSAPFLAGLGVLVLLLLVSAGTGWRRRRHDEARVHS